MSMHLDTSKLGVLTNLHPLLFAIVPIMLVAAVNTDQLELAMLLLPTLAALVAALAVWAASYAVFRNAARSAVITSFVLFAFFFHGHLHHGLATMAPWLRSRYAHLGLVGIWLTSFGVICYWIVNRSVIERASRLLTTTMLTLLIFSTCQLALGMLSSGHRSSQVPVNDVVKARKAARPIQDLPDVYYIILDGYGRHDVLKELYGIDNSSFLTWLEEHGFYVARESRSNYTQTFLSLASSTNMRFINVDAQRIGKTKRDLLPIKTLIHNNEIARYLKSQGYLVVHMNTNWQGTEKSDVADASFPVTLSEFQKVLLETTILQPILVQKAGSYRLPFLWPRDAALHRLHFRKLEEISTWDQPTYTLAHFICPHPPYYFGQDEPFDEVRHTWKNRKGYANQLKFLNARIQQLITTIRENSSTPPIIILQADHGPASTLDEKKPAEMQPDFITERMSILNAYHVPDSFRQGLYPEITPVNTFRLMIRTVFEQEEVELLPDRCFFSWKDRPYDFIDVTNDF